MINATLVGDKELIAKLKAMPDKLRTALVRKVTSLSLRLEAYIKTSKLSGQVLRVRTGDLKASINHQVIDSDNMVMARVFSANVKYAAIHEFGGTIHHPGGQPYMVIAGQGAVFVSKAKAAAAHVAGFTKAHIITMPERSYMRSGLRDMSGAIREGLLEAAREGVRK